VKCKLSIILKKIYGVVKYMAKHVIRVINNNTWFWQQFNNSNTSSTYPVIFFLTLYLFLEITPVGEKKWKWNRFLFHSQCVSSNMHVFCHTDEALNKNVILLISIVLGEDRWVFKNGSSLPIISLARFQEFTSKIQEEKNIKRRSSRQHASS